MASRPIAPKEVQICKSKGVSFVELPVAWDALVLIANRNDGWLRDISVSELRSLWGPEAMGKKLAWNQIRSNYPATPVALFGFDQKSGTFDFFSQAVSGSSKLIRADYQEAASHDVIADRVSKTPGSLGYISLAAYADHSGKVAALALADTNGLVLPSSQSVVSGQYEKLSRLLFVYVNKASYDSRPAVRDFSAYLLEGGARFATYARFVPLTQQNYTDQLARLRRGDLGSVQTR